MNNRFKIIRKQLGLTQTELGEKLGRGLRAIQHYEKGERGIDDALILLLERTFNVNPSWLREGVGEMFAPPQGGSSLVMEGLTGIHAEMAALTPKLRGKYAEQALEYIKERLKFQEDEEKALPERTSNKKTA